MSKIPASVRSLRTRAELRDALASLISEKGYDDVPVQEILNRADVGRSTFYAHFTDKDDLLRSSILEIVDGAKSRKFADYRERLLWFSRPLLEFHEQHRHQMKIGRGEVERVHGHLRRVLLGLLAEDVREWPPSLRSGAKMPMDLLVEHIVSTFIRVLNWWLENRSAMTAHDADAMFRELVQPALADIP